MRVCVCVYAHTHTHCTDGVLGCEPSSRDETPGGPEKSRWTKSRHTYIRICVLHLSIYMLVGKSKNLIKSEIAQLTRGHQNATFAEATAACAAQGKTIVTSIIREARFNLLERAGSDLQSLCWVGALKDEECTSKWRWSAAAAPDECLMDKDSFREGDFACFYIETGLSLVDVPQQCQNQGRILKVPRNEEFATLSHIKLSCPDLSSGCHICENPNLDIIAVHQSLTEDGFTPWGGAYGLSSQKVLY